MVGAVTGQSCPIPAPHRRLLDAHERWDAVGENYMEPTAFRRNLNQLIPEPRNISWLVQETKESLAGFDYWYPQWQERAEGQPRHEVDLELEKSC